jgi:hypothetical protein
LSSKKVRRERKGRNSCVRDDGLGWKKVRRERKGRNSGVRDDELKSGDL